MHQVFPAGEEVGGLAVILSSLYEIFWSALVLLIVPLPAGEFALPKIYRTMDECQAKIAEGLTAAEKAKEDRVLAARERTQVLVEANAGAYEIRECAREEAKGIIAATRTEAQEEANWILEDAQRQTLAEKQVAEISLRAGVGLLATGLAEKIVGEYLADTALTNRVTDRSLDDLEEDNPPASEGVTR